MARSRKFRSPRRLGTTFLSRPLVLMIAALVAMAWLYGERQRSTGPLFSRWAPPAASTDPADIIATGRGFPLCGHGLRSNCVVDGDTFWIDGEKVRIANIDAPEMNGRCDHESRLAQRARMRLSVLLTGSGLRLYRQGLDRYGRTLAAIRVGSDDAGRVLVREGLAQPWRGRKAVWCG